LDNRLKHIFAASAGLICLVIYILTLFPSITFLDSGELATVSYTFGVPHPTGYPLFLIIGWIVSHIPIGTSVIYRLNLLSAIESAAAVIITFYTLCLLVNSALASFGKDRNQKSKAKDSAVHRDSAKKKNKHESKSTSTEPILTAQRSISTNETSLLVYLVSFFTSVSIGLFRTIWLNAIQIEVYALHFFFISLFVLLSVKIIQNLQSPRKSDWIWLFLVLGFSAANHSTTIYFLPGIAYLIYLQYKTSKEFARSVLPYVLLVIPGLLLYLVLMIAASYGPYLNWSNPTDIGSLISHLRGADFSQLMFSSSSKFSENFAAFFKGIAGEMAILPLILAVIGLWVYNKVNKAFLIFSLIGIFISLLYSFTYNTIEITSFYLLVYYLLGLMVSGSILYFAARGRSITTVSFASVKLKVIAAGALLVIAAGAYNFNECDNSKNVANAEYTANTLNTMEQNSILLCYDWSYQYSGSFYYQLAEGLRRDVKVLNVKFLSVPWYLETIRKFYPDIYEGIKQQADDYIAVYGQEEKVKSPKLAALVKAFVESAGKRYPLYITIDLVLSKEMSALLSPYKLSPNGLVYKVEDKNAAYHPDAGISSLGVSFHRFEPTGNYRKNLAKYIPGLYYETAYYHYINKNFELSLKFLDKSLEFDTSFKDALNLKTLIAQGK